MKKLTGKYYIKKTLIGWQIKVETIVIKRDEFINETTPQKIWQNASIADLVNLGIYCK